MSTSSVFCNTLVLHCKFFFVTLRQSLLTADSYISSILGFKLSLLLSYLRFIPKGIYRWSTFATIGLCIAYHIAFLVVQINLCTPVLRTFEVNIEFQR